VTVEVRAGQVVPQGQKERQWRSTALMWNLSGIAAGEGKEKSMDPG